MMKIPELQMKYKWWNQGVRSNHKLKRHDYTTSPWYFSYYFIDDYTVFYLYLCSLLLEEHINRKTVLYK